MELNSNMKPTRRIVRGFTLVEVLLLIAILLLVLFMVIPALNKMRHARREKAAVIAAPAPARL